MVASTSYKYALTRDLAELTFPADHQTYADWWYLWSLSYFANMQEHVLIVLKKSLKWVPILGWVSALSVAPG